MAMSVIQAVEVYLEDCEANEQSARTIEGKISNLNCFSKFLAGVGITKLDNVTDTVLEKYRVYIKDYRNPHTKKTVCQATRRNKLTNAKVFLQRMYRLKHISHNPSEFFDLPKRPRTLVKAIMTETELNKMLLQTELFGDKGIRDRAIMETFWSTGMRAFELAGLTLDSVHWEDQTILISKGKGKKDRLIPLGEIALDHIKKYLNKVRKKQVTLLSDDALFLNNNGSPFTYRQLATLINSYKKRVGINKPNACYLFRYLCATTMINNGAGLMHVQQILGHEDLSTTQNYVHLAINDLKQDFYRTHPSAKR